MLSLVEEIVLLRLDHAGGGSAEPELPEAAVLAGAAMMELALQKRIDTDLNRLFVDDPRPGGDDILDHVLSVLAETALGSRVSPAIERLNLKTSDAIGEIARHASRYRAGALKRLVEKGVLREETEQSSPRYTVIDDTGLRALKARLRQLILADEIPDPRDVVRLWLVAACGLLTDILTPDEIAARRRRIELLTQLDLLGQAVTKAADEIRFILQHAAAPIRSSQR